MTRRKFLFSALGSGACSLAYPCYMEPRWLELTVQHVQLSRSQVGAPLRLLHISDLHASFYVPLGMISHAIDLGLAQKPDLICVTGDFITHRHDFDKREYAGVLGRLSAAAPAYAVLGNHDGGLWASSRLGYPDHRTVERLLEDAGIELLHNRSTMIETPGRTLNLVGVGDLWSDEIHATRAFSGSRTASATILMSHNPDSKRMLREFPWDLMLSGHTHGGQVIIPFQGARYAPVEDKRYVAGLKPWGQRQIHVTRGVGSVAGVRFRCRPEVSLLIVA